MRNIRCEHTSEEQHVVDFDAKDRLLMARRGSRDVGFKF